MEFHLAELYNYHHAMNLKVAELLINHQDKIDGSAYKLFSHILGAQNIWNSRILEKAHTIPVWEIQPTHLFIEIENNNHAESIQILEHKQPHVEIEYINLQGISFKNTISDILFHAANHATYHRAQIATIIKQSGLTPPVTDYIAFKRMPL